VKKGVQHELFDSPWFEQFRPEPLAEFLGEEFAQRIACLPALLGQASKREWVATLDETVRQLKGDTILVSHSLGSVTTVFWLLRAQEKHELPANIKGVFRWHLPIPMW
jgi:Predicted esterase of the alpha/beta hydrolase fold